MGMDFEVYKLNKIDRKTWQQERLLYMRKPYHLANCCYLVANGLTEYEDWGLPVFGEWPFTNEMLVRVLDLALETEKTNKVDWSHDNTRREEYIKEWELLIERTKDEWVIIEWS